MASRNNRAGRRASRTEKKGQRNSKSQKIVPSRSPLKTPNCPNRAATVREQQLFSAGGANPDISYCFAGLCASTWKISCWNSIAHPHYWTKKAEIPLFLGDISRYWEFSIDRLLAVDYEPKKLVRMEELWKIPISFLPCVPSRENWESHSLPRQATFRWMYVSDMERG
jgi:hypothetical protein